MPEGAAYTRCTFCSAESFVDLNGVLLHQVIRVTIPRGRVPGLIKARALEAGWPEARLTRLELVYEPVWELESPSGARIGISARPGPEGRFNRTELPSGERASTETGPGDGGAEWREPELAPESLAEVAARVTGRPVAIKTVRLVHRPIYHGEVQVAGERHGFQVDAATGNVLAVEWPVESTFGNRNRAWLVTAAMAITATLLPLPLAAAVVVLGGLTARLLWRGGRPALPEAR